MQWSKIKNIVILLLLAVDLLLLGQLALREVESARLLRQAREEAAALLAQSGIQVDLPALPEDHDLTPLRCERDSSGEPELAAALLGEVALGEDGSYVGAMGRIWFYSSGDFGVELAPEAYPLGERDAAQLAGEVLGKLNFQGQLLEEETGEDGTVSVRMRQLWEGAPVFSCDVTITFYGGSLREIRGRRLPGTPAAAAGTPISTVTTALIRFLSGITDGGYVRSQVKGMTAGYEMTAVPASGAFKLTPVWQIETDGSPFRLDGKGNLTQLTE